VLRNIRRSKLSTNFEYRFGPDKQWRVLVANTRELREKAFRLVYDVYIREGYDLRYGRESGLWCTIHHLLPDTTIFLAEQEGRLTGSVTVMPIQGWGSRRTASSRSRWPISGRPAGI